MLPMTVAALRANAGRLHSQPCPLSGPTAARQQTTKQASKPAGKPSHLSPWFAFFLCVFCVGAWCAPCVRYLCVRACWLAVALRRGRWANKAATVAPSSPQGGLHMCRWWVDPNLGKRPALPHQPKLYLEPKWLRWLFRGFVGLRLRAKASAATMQQVC